MMFSLIGLVRSIQKKIYLPNWLLVLLCFSNIGYSNYLHLQNDLMSFEITILQMNFANTQKYIVFVDEKVSHIEHNIADIKYINLEILERVKTNLKKVKSN